MPLPHSALHTTHMPLSHNNNQITKFFNAAESLLRTGSTSEDIPSILRNPSSPSTVTDPHPQPHTSSPLDTIRLFYIGFKNIQPPKDRFLRNSYTVILPCTDMRRLTMGIRSDKCVFRRFRSCANVYLHKPR